jgi:electron transport complex protein RnfC
VSVATVDAFRPVPMSAAAAGPAVPTRATSPDLTAQLAAIAGGAVVSDVVCCALDTDPAVALNGAVVTSAIDQVMAGIARLSAAAGGARATVVADPTATRAWAALRAAVRRPARLVPLHNDYPQADPSLLLYSLLRRRLRPGQLPTDCRVLLFDAAAAAEAGPEAGPVRVAVRDHFASQTHLLSAEAGTPLADVLRFVGFDPAAVTLRAGEFLRDRFVRPDAAVTAAGERVFHASAPTLAANPDPCVRCGWCVEACPTRIHPAGLLDAAQRGDAALADRYGLSGCIECGICSYVCPTRLPLLAAIRGLRSGAGVRT